MYSGIHMYIGINYVHMCHGMKQKACCSSHSSSSLCQLLSVTLYIKGMIVFPLNSLQSVKINLETQNCVTTHRLRTAE